MKKVFKAIGKYLRETPPHVIVLAVALLLLIGAVITASTVLGKYTVDTRIYGTFEVSTRLAERFALQEHRAVQGEDGSYTLHPTDLVTTNTYQLIPGLTIPKDPYIAIVDKTSIPAYIYVEVLPTLVSPSVSYGINTMYWTQLTGVTGPHGGQVYSYAAGLVDNNSTGLGNIPILAGNSFSLPPTPITGADECLTFYGYLIEPTSASATATATFTGTFH